MFMHRTKISYLGIRLIEEIGKSGIKVLLILYEHDKLPISEIWRRGVGHTAFYNALGKLKALGLVEEERIGNTRLIKLTPLGREVAEYLKIIDQKVEMYARASLKP